MRVLLESTEVPRVYNVTLDFTGYNKEHAKYFGRHSHGYYWITKVPTSVLDKSLEALKLRRLKWWDCEWPKPYWKRVLVYKVTVISDRDL